MTAARKAGRFVRVEGDQGPLTRLETREPKGLIVVITGPGKGKTTTALELAVRACGHNPRTSIIQFMSSLLRVCPGEAPPGAGGVRVAVSRKCLALLVISTDY